MRAAAVTSHFWPDDRVCRTEGASERAAPPADWHTPTPTSLATGGTAPPYLRINPPPFPPFPTASCARYVFCSRHAGVPCACICVRLRACVCVCVVCVRRVVAITPYSRTPRQLQNRGVSTSRCEGSRNGLPPPAAAAGGEQFVIRISTNLVQSHCDRTPIQIQVCLPAFSAV